MKDSEFLELLNLYLDHEISAADAARLEAEVQGNPERRRVYQDYCRMQKACTLLAKDFAEAPADAAADRKVVAFEPSRSWGPGFYALGGVVAAAACLAVVLIKREPAAPAISGEGVTVAQVPASKPADVSVVIPQGGIISANSPAVARTVTLRTDLQPVVALRALSLSTSSNNGATLLAANPEPMQQLDWIQGLKIAPMKNDATAPFTAEVKISEPQKAGVQAPDESIAKYLVGFGYGKGN